MIKTNLKKILCIFALFTFLFSIITSVHATNDISINIIENEINNSSDSVYANTSLELVEDNICHIDVGGVGEFEKKITEFNETEKSAILTLTMKNIKSVEESQEDVEIFFVIDNSYSMTQGYVDGITRKDAVIKSANSLVDKLFASNPNVKIGVVGFSSLDTSAGETEGTINDAKLQTVLTSSKDEVKNAISDLSTLKTGPRTNIEAGLTIAQENFSTEENTKRYLVLLTDGVPNNATDGTFGKYSGTVASRTKAKLEEIQNAKVNIISAMINLDSEKIEPTTNKTYRQLSEEIFGTVSSPTTDVYYYITDEELEKTIVEDIYNDLVVRKDNTLKNIVITDYFPQEIIDNFDFEYVSSPNIGKVSEKIDTSNNSITWNIELLSEGEVATLSYKLTLKKDYDMNIIDKVLPTNEKVDITGENDGNKITETSNESPKIKVKYEKEIIVNEIDDNTVSPDPIPQTGEGSISWLLSIVVILAVLLIARIVYLKNNSNN